MTLIDPQQPHAFRPEWLPGYASPLCRRCNLTFDHPIHRWTERVRMRLTHRVK